MKEERTFHFGAPLRNRATPLIQGHQSSTFTYKILRALPRERVFSFAIGLVCGMHDSKNNVILAGALDF